MAGSHNPGAGIDDSYTQECHVWSEASASLSSLAEYESDIIRR